MEDKILKRLQEITLGIEDDVFTLPTILYKEAKEENQFTLVAKPINPWRKIFERWCLHSFIYGEWVKKCFGRLVKNHLIQFIFWLEETLLSVLRKDLWSFNEWMVAFQWWSPNQTAEDLKFISFWVQFCGIPFQFLQFFNFLHFVCYTYRPYDGYVFGDRFPIWEW